MNTPRYFDGSPASPTQQKLDELNAERTQIISKLTPIERRRLEAIGKEIERILSSMK